MTLRAIEEDPMEDLIQTFSGAAATAAVSAIQHQKPLAYATLEDDRRVAVGLVVVCLNEHETAAMLAYIRSRGGEIILGRPE